MNLKIKSFYSVFFVFLTFFLFSNCVNKENDYVDPRGNMYAGSVSCKECHQEIYNDALKSTHFMASEVASKENILGDFNSIHNTYYYDQDTKIVMETRKNNFYQVLYKNEKEVKAYKIDIVMGKKNAQTGLFWERDKVYELPLSYYTSVKNWGTSPDYPIHQPYFNRLIAKDCFECHSSYLERKKERTPSEEYFGKEKTPEEMKKSTLVYGIDCERCHGPAINHVNYHLAYPEIKTAKYIVTNASLTTKQRLDRCAICHYGDDKLKLQSRFQFIPGDDITNFYSESYPNSNADFDVHGNQYGLLSESKCFIKSNTMDCITCHSPHKEVAESTSFYSQKCMSCHSEVKNNFCTTTTLPIHLLNNNCIDCHMPKKASGAISYRLSGKTENSSYILRSHRIAIYKDKQIK